RRARQEIQGALRLSRENPELSMQLARAVPHGTPLSGPIAALLYAQAYGTGASQNAAMRGAASFWLYRYVQSLRKRDVILVNWLASVIQGYKSAGLYAFLALAAHN